MPPAIIHREPRTMPTQTGTTLFSQHSARVYALFDLSPAEIVIIEASTKHRYGEV
jgi:hypothetical protein